jgi:spermidine synthase
MRAFPNGVVFANNTSEGGYDLVLVGQNGPMRIDVDAIEAKLASPEYARVAASLREIGFNDATQLFTTFAGNAEMLRPWLADAQINRDRNLRLQFLAGEGLNQYTQGEIFSHMAPYRRYPEGLFVGAPERLDRIRAGEGY